MRTGNGRPAASAPAVGTPGDACTEAQATTAAATATFGSASRPGTIAVSASGFRAGESVAVSIDRTSLGRATADANGKLRFKTTKAGSFAARSHVVHALGYGSGQRGRGTFTTR